MAFCPRSRQSLPEVQTTVHFSPLGKTPALMGRRLEIVLVRMAFWKDGEVWDREEGKNAQWDHHDKTGAEYEGRKWPQVPRDSPFFW